MYFGRSPTKEGFPSFKHTNITPQKHNAEK